MGIYAEDSGEMQPRTELLDDPEELDEEEEWDEEEEENEELASQIEDPEDEDED